MLPSEVLSAAADLIEPEGAWTQGALGKTATGAAVWNENDPRIVCRCMFGGIWKAAGRDGGDMAYARNLRAFLVRVIGAEEDNLTDWNDAPDRTQAEVVKALRDAAELARSEGQ